MFVSGQCMLSSMIRQHTLGLLGHKYSPFVNHLLSVDETQYHMAYARFHPVPTKSVGSQEGFIWCVFAYGQPVHTRCSMMNDTGGAGPTW